MKNYFLSLLCLLALYMAPSCKDDEEDCAEAVTAASAQATVVFNAAFAYGLDSSATNCQTLKSALETFIDLAEPVKNCDGVTQQQRDDYEQQIQEAEDDIATLPC